MSDDFTKTINKRIRYIVENLPKDFSIKDGIRLPEYDYDILLVHQSDEVWMDSRQVEEAIKHNTLKDKFSRNYHQAQ